MGQVEAWADMGITPFGACFAFRADILGGVVFKGWGLGFWEGVPHHPGAWRCC